MVGRLITALNRPVDAASLALFRIAFGVLLVVAALRFFTNGWIAADYQAAQVFFPYWGLSFVRPWPGVGMQVHYAVMAASAVLIAIGFWYRAATVVFAFAFVYAHLCDKTNYLNHYYLVSLLALGLCVMPLDREWSLRVWLRPTDRRRDVRAWMVYVLRFQIGVVYVFGGIGKLGSDWLLHAEPLRIWLHADAELPVLRYVATARWLPYAFSWAGMIFDLAIVPLLLWRRTRPVAYVVAVVFHATTRLLFPIGMFPWIMCVGATLFFAPEWPRRFFRGDRSDEPVVSAPLGRPALALLALYVVVQVLVPLRAWLYPGNTLWTEEGFRFAWRVMLIEKSGELEYDVVDRDGRRITVSPRQYLTKFQLRQASTQPDMILQLAQVIAADYDARGRGPVRVYADAQVSWNGRLHAQLIDPKVDLAAERDGLGAKRWILPAPTSPPAF